MRSLHLKPHRRRAPETLVEPRLEREQVDESEITIGDRLLDKIDRGITSCRFGVVILSPSFFQKKWPRRELSGLAAREDAEDRKLILPIRFGLTPDEITKESALHPRRRFAFCLMHDECSEPACARFVPKSKRPVRRTRPDSAPLLHHRRA